MKKIRIAQIGVTHEHAVGKMLSLKALPEVFEIAGYVNDLALTKTPRLGETLHPCFHDLKSLSLEEVLCDPSIRAVTVEVPNDELVPFAMKFAEKGVAIHMDKPAGPDLMLYRKLLALCKAKKIPFQMGFMFRSNPAFRFCLQAIRKKWIWEVSFIEADMNHCYGGEPYQDYIGKFPGGIMYNLGCHIIDFIVSAMGRPRKVTPFLRSASGYPASVKNNCLAVLEYPNAFAVVAACSKTSGNIDARMLRVNGDKGSLFVSPLEHFDGAAIEMELRLCEGNEVYPAGTHTLRFPPQKDRYANQLTELAEVIRGEREVSFPLEHDDLVHEVTLAAAGLLDWTP